MKSLDSFPRVSLGIFPTPIQRLENLSALLGVNLYVKRDDLTGLGLGGNKVRKLEYLLADAKSQGAELVFTTGGAQSNHAMLTAAAANKLGMRSILILKQRGVTDCVGSNEVHALKPEEAMFAAFERRFGVPDLYLDDRMDLINAANARGWHAVQARRDVGSLRRELGIF